MEFFRFYFFSDEDFVEFLGIFRNFKVFFLFAKMCFFGIEILNFVFFDGIFSMNIVLDFVLNGMGVSFICNLFIGYIL